MHSSVKRRGAVGTYYVIKFFGNLNFTLPIWVLFGHEYLGFSYLITVLVSTLPNYLFSALLQVPCGAWADKHGRTCAFAIGTLLIWVGIAPFLLTKEAWIFFAAIPFTSLGVALRDGSMESIVSTITHESSSTQYSDITANGQSLRYVARVVASVAGGALYLADPRLPMVAAILGEIVALACVLFLMPDDKRISKTLETTRVRDVLHQGVAAIHRDRTIWMMFAFFFFTLFCGEMVWLGYQPTFDDRHINSFVVGCAFAAFSLLSAWGNQLVKKPLRTSTAAFVFQFHLALTFVTATGMLVIGGSWVVLAPVPMQIVLGIGGPLLNTYIASRTPVHVRTTTLSFVDLFTGVSVAVSGVVSSLLLDHAGIDWLFGVSGVICLITLTFTLRKSVAQPITAAHVEPSAIPQPQ
jgi:MFS family permease